jgi:tRNA U54 and U55 pseudouridine synthase Pus10
VSNLAAATRQSDVLTVQYLEHAGVMPLGLTDGRMIVATWREDIDVQVLDDLEILFDVELSIERNDEHELRGAIKRLYATDTTAQSVIDAASPSFGQD